MNLQQVLFFVFSAYSLAQNQQAQDQQQQYYNQQPYSVISSYYNNYHPSGQYRESYYSAHSVEMNNISSHRQDRMAERQKAVQSISSYAAANGYNDPASLPEDVRSSIIASYIAANSAKISQRIESASAFMATQTQINTASLAQSISSIAATATGKKKGLFQRLKMKKTATSGTDTVAANATTTTGLNQGFKNFFKSIQMKIQKSSVASTPTPTSTA